MSDEIDRIALKLAIDRLIDISSRYEPDDGAWLSAENAACLLKEINRLRGLENRLTKA